MAPKKKETKRAGKTGEGRKAKRSTSARGKRQALQRPAATARTDPTGRTRGAARAAAALVPPALVGGEGLDDRADADAEDDDVEAGPPRKSAKPTGPLKREAPEDDDEEEEDEDAAGSSTRPPPAKRSKPDKGKGRAIDPPEEPGDAGANEEPGAPAIDPPERQGDEDGEDFEDGDEADEATVDGDKRVQRYFDELEHVYATSESRDRVNFEGNQADLVLSLKVFRDPLRPIARLGYHAQLLLIQTVQNASGEDIERTRVIGYIQAWRITKRTARLPNVSNEPLTDLLNENDAYSPVDETTRCLLVIFRLDAQPRAGVGEHIAQLRDNSLMFIEMIYIRPQFSGRGLLRPAFDRFYEALSRLPEWFAFAGSLVLSPAPPRDSKGDVWVPGGLNEKEIEAAVVAAEETLINIYRGRDFAVWVRKGPVRGHLITIMGRATQ